RPARLHLAPPPPRSPPIPYPTLFRSLCGGGRGRHGGRAVAGEGEQAVPRRGEVAAVHRRRLQRGHGVAGGVEGVPRLLLAVGQLDRKSTRLNSSHVKISYAVFCLKKK